MRRRKTSQRDYDKATVGLAVLAMATAGTVIGGAVAKMIRRRRQSEDVPTPGTFAGAVGMATRDTLAVARVAHDAAPRHEQILFNILAGFLGGFSFMRLATWGQRGGWWPTGPIAVGDRHIHHFVPGILIAFGCGGAGLATNNSRLEETLAVGFGVGAGFTFDEAALLLDLQDVYWSRDGLLSVQLSFGVTAVLAASILAMRMLRRGEERGAKQGVIPPLSSRERAEATAAA